MGFLRRLGGSKPGPAWAGKLDAKGFERFLRVLDAEMHRRGWDYRVEGDGLTTREGGGAPRAYGLSNLAQLCGQLDRREWPTVVQSHFDNMLAGEQANSSDDPFADFERAKPNLRLRIFAEDTSFGAGMDLVRYPLAPGLMAVLTLDLPTTVVTVPAKTASEWAPVDELYRLALDGIRREPAPGRQVADFGQGTAIVELGDSFFTASRLLLLPEVVDLEGADGALVAVPTRHALAVHVIRDTSVVSVLGLFAVFANNMWKAGPGSISPSVYWWHAGALTPIPVDIDEGSRVSIRPPDAFVELLNEIAARP
jgi:hypothetical protein